MATPVGSQTTSVPAVERSAAHQGTQSAAWAGWVTFASVLFIVLGIFNVIDGIAALAKHQVFVTTSNAQIVFNLTAWGWILIAFGALQLIAGYFLRTGAVWVRSVAVVLCMLNAVAQLAFLPRNPAWSTLVIALDIFTIWALVVHGNQGRRDIW
jgi:hypothetical protein